MRKCVIITKIGYPFGGGEDYLFSTIQWLIESNIDVIWLCFGDLYHNLYTEFKVFHEYIIQIPRGFDKTTIRNWVTLLSPDIIHTQGLGLEIILPALIPLKIPILLGYHFWVNLVDLYPKYFNRDIKNNIKYHSKNNFFESLSEHELITPYVCSDFMSDVFKLVYNSDIHVVYPISSEVRCKNVSIVVDRIYVTQINIHQLKGGEIFLDSISKLENIPFLCVQTEPCSESLDSKIKSLMNLRTNCIYRTHVDNIKEIYELTRILLVPSLIDETFCRVVCEGMMNGIPIITTGNGNISNLLGDYGIYLSDKDDWSEQIRAIYEDEQLYNLYSTKLKTRYNNLFSESIAKEQLLNLIDYRLSLPINIMIIAPFCDQGLGIQARNYYYALKELNQNVFIFSYASYYSLSENFQKDKEEWNQENVYYSCNIREEIEDKEIIDFVHGFNITHCIFPETCWNRVFEIALLLKSLRVKCFAVPNIEIVRRDELYKHTYFHKVLCNNQLCLEYFQNIPGIKSEYIGYGIVYPLRPLKPKLNNNVIQFCCFGGLNALSRKQIIKVCKAFIISQEECKNIRLIVTSQKKEKPSELDKMKGLEGITIIEEHLPYKKILEILKYSHVSIQVSKQEGLGLGFYESIFAHTPVISLNTQPHNEIIKHDINGWLIDCFYENNHENDSSMVEEANFKEHNLAKVITQIAQNPDTLNDIQDCLETDYNQRLSGDIFKKKFLYVIQ